MGKGKWKQQDHKTFNRNVSIWKSDNYGKSEKTERELLMKQMKTVRELRAKGNENHDRTTGQGKWKQREGYRHREMKTTKELKTKNYGKGKWKQRENYWQRELKSTKEL